MCNDQQVEERGCQFDKDLGLDEQIMGIKIVHDKKAKKLFKEKYIERVLALYSCLIIWYVYFVVPKHKNLSE